MSSSSPIAVPLGLPAKRRGTLLGFLVMGGALTLALTMAFSRVEERELVVAEHELSAAGVAFIDGRGVLPFTGTLATQMHVIAKDARSTYFTGHNVFANAHCMFVHGQSVRVLYTADNAVHVAANDGCSAWLERAWVSPVKRPATGLYFSGVSSLAPRAAGLLK